ncbi:glycerate kinase [Liberiplasma polymorphum]|uniref:glycerate kinase n=1 Tax=Liberiplasma polymorphum TaxID=3374570 RepID=UPI0037718156
MKILIAMDSFKGSLTSLETANAVEEGILQVTNTHSIIKTPIADGGEGTVDAFTQALNGKRIYLEVHDPLMRKIRAYYGLLPNKVAVIEMAQASGITLLKADELNPLYTTTYGLGDMIKDALKHHVNTIIIGVGGSATNDAGIGMLASLGYKFYDRYKAPLQPIGENLIHINEVDASHAVKLPKDVNILVATDVINPLYGPNGAAHIYAPQKGANKEIVKILDKGLKHYASYIYNIESIDLQKIKGSGAAGGLPASLIPYLKATLKPGIELVFDAINLEEQISKADLIITGEGKIDIQTLMGKAPLGVIKIADKYNKPVIVLAGQITKEGNELKKYKNVSLYNINNMNQENDIMNTKTAYKNTLNTIKNIIININD